MAQQTINVGSANNDGTGDPLRMAMIKVQNNFSELYTISVNTSQLTANLNNYVTLAGLPANVAILSANNSTYFNSQNSAYYTNATNIDSGTLAYERLGPNVVNTTSDFTISGIHTHSSNLVISAGLSANGGYGSDGQVLTTNGTVAYWSTPATFSVDVAAQYSWTNTHTFSNTIFLNAVSANGSLGTNGQVLTSNGSDSYWSTMNGFTTLTDGASISWDATNHMATLTLTGTGRTLNEPTNLVAGHTYMLIIKQDAGGNKTITSWPNIVKWPGGTVITLSTGANAIDVVTFGYDGTNMYAVGQKAFA